MQTYVVFYLAASLGYINTICWVRFGLFIAFYTGNLVVAIFALFSANWREVAFRVVVMLSHTIIGVKMSQLIGEKVPSSWWHLQCLWILLSSCLLFAEFVFPNNLDPSEHQSQIWGFHSYYVLSEIEMAQISFIAAGVVAMGHYATRLPVLTQVMTIPMIKLAEATSVLPRRRRKGAHNIEKWADSETLRQFSFAGCISGIMAAAGLMVMLPTRSYTLIPVLILWPLMLHAQARSNKDRQSDCCEEPDSEIYQISVADGEDNPHTEDSDDSLGVFHQ